ncbi:MAG: DUF4159 domain-containing protein [Planctomycetes bacterium]|nr:DUF4159 domain-containing protein [Planctomycetota bacterium]
MSRRSWRLPVGILLSLVFAASLVATPVLLAQRNRAAGQRGGGIGALFGGGRRQPEAADRSEYPQWELPPAFSDDVFTFTRVQYDSGRGRRGGFGGGGENWRNDFPDCDWNFSARLHELTALAVDPNGKVLRLTDEDLCDYPFLYMSNVQNMDLSDEEVTALRNYLLKGGFLMADDFWAPAAWRHVKSVMERVFPDRSPRELSLDHEIFHIVYNFQELPQVPSILAWRRGDKFEYWHGDPEGDEAPHFYGMFDDRGRLMALLCHNNDIGDGWEREGEEKEYFQQYSEKFSYPLGINIITYAMTH